MKSPQKFDKEKAVTTTRITQAAVGLDGGNDANVPRTRPRDNPPDDGGDGEDQFCDGKDQFFDAEDKCSVEENRSDEGDEFFEVTDMSMLRERAETPTTVQRDRVHEASDVQQDFDQEGRDDQHAAAGQDDDAEGATQIPDVGRQTRPRKSL